MLQRGINKLIEMKDCLFSSYMVKAYSQEGEDILLNRIFEGQESGFYIDVGAHHPKRFSNTYFFYKKGWRGINIDAMPGSMVLFKKERPRDINLEQAVYDKRETLTYYIFNEPALNGFSRSISKERAKSDNYYIIAEKKISTVTLEEILDKYMNNGQQIDFLSIDVEGVDFAVLRSNNFNKYRPKVILIEMLKSKLEDVVKHEITVYLKELRYFVFAKLFNTVFFMDDDFYDYCSFSKHL